MARVFKGEPIDGPRYGRGPSIEQSLQCSDVLGFGALLALAHIELDLLAVSKVLETLLSDQVGEMDEHVSLS